MRTSKYMVARVKVSDDLVEVNDDQAAKLVVFGIEQGIAEFFLEEEKDPSYEGHPVGCTCIFCIPGA